MLEEFQVGTLFIANDLYVPCLEKYYKRYQVQEGQEVCLLTMLECVAPTATRRQRRKEDGLMLKEQREAVISNDRLPRQPDV
jgi:hypothetical protein